MLMCLNMVTEKKLKKAEKIDKVEPKTDTSKIYELGYLLLPKITTDRALIEEKVLMDFFVKGGGELISSEHPVLIDLAYPMLKVIHAHREKCNQGYFGWMKFEIETKALEDIKKNIDLSEMVLRYLLIKTVRGNTLLDGKMNFGEALEKSKQPEEDEEAVQEKEKTESVIDEDQLDKSIDDLVIA